MMADPDRLGERALAPHGRTPLDHAARFAPAAGPVKRFQLACGTLALRPEAGGPSEAAFLYLLFSSNKAPEMALMPIDARHKEFLLQVQFRSMNMTYRRNFAAARFEIIELDRWPIGRIVTDVREDCVYYVDFALLPQAQGIGIGTALMQALLEEPKRLGLPARLRALSYNVAARQLWRKLGFIEIADEPPYARLEWRPRR